MKLNCIVQLREDKYFPTKWQRSVLSLEKKIDSYTKEAYLLWKPDGKNQVKYLILTKNLRFFRCNLKYNGEAQAFTPKHLFLSQKDFKDSYLISFKYPFHTFVIRGIDKASFHKFTNLLECISSRYWYSFYKESSITSDVTLNNKHLYVKRRNYPPRKGFPKTTRHLILRTLNITELHLQIILNLHRLTILDLSYNQIVFLPKELGTLLHLEKLNVSHNCLGNTCSEIAKWEWMEQTGISQSLKELNISNNNLTELPLQVGKLQSLISLDVCQNLLTKVPQIIGTLYQLEVLTLSHNLLSYLPGSMRGMELSMLFISSNPFRDLRVDDRYRSSTLKVVSLLDLAAKAVKKYKKPYNNLPFRLARYLDNCKYCCICRNPCFHSDIKSFELLADEKYQPFDTKRVYEVCEDSFLLKEKPLFKCYFCSSKCYAYYYNICCIK